MGPSNAVLRLKYKQNRANLKYPILLQAECKCHNQTKLIQLQTEPTQDLDCGAVALSAPFFSFGVLDGRC